MHIAGGVIVGIEKIGVLRDFGAVALHPGFEDEGFEKPARVGEMPFRRADVRHRLHDVIFRFEVPAKMGAEIAHLSKLRDQTLTGRAGRSDAAFSGAARCLGHQGFGLVQNRSALLLEFFPAGLHHLVVGSFFDPVRDELFAEIFLVLDPRRAMTGR